MSWKPLLHGHDAHEARAIVRAIAQDIGEPSAGIRRDAHDCALLHAYLAESGVFPEGGDRATRFLDESSARLAGDCLPPWLFGGFPGLAWTFAHVAAFDADTDDDDALSPIDDALLALTRRTPWSQDFDLGTGLVGFAVYALERRPRRSADLLLREVLSRLRENVEIDEEGSRWLTPPHLLAPDRRGTRPDGEYDLGMAHGNAGVLALLARVADDDAATDLLDGSVRWLMAQSRGGERSPRFPFCVVPGKEPSPSRSAWCYGDCGIAVALLAAATARRRDDWRSEAIAIARAAPAAGDERAGVIDSALCHGAAGLGHLYNRLYQATGDEQLRARALGWLRQSLTMRMPDQLGFLDGRCGVALALLAAISEVTPAWDRLLLASLE